MFEIEENRFVKKVIWRNERYETNEKGNIDWCNFCQYIVKFLFLSSSIHGRDELPGGNTRYR